MPHRPIPKAPSAILHILSATAPRGGALEGESMAECGLQQENEYE